MKTTATLDNDIGQADRRHPVDFLELIDGSIDRICEVLQLHTMP